MNEIDPKAKYFKANIELTKNPSKFYTTITELKLPV